MTQYLIRSMAMTDYPPRYNKLPEPFHTYLLKPEKRHGGSCWSIYCGHVQLFDLSPMHWPTVRRSWATNASMWSR